MYVSVGLRLPFCEFLTYNLPDKFLEFSTPEDLLGSLVLVPFGNKKIYGILWSLDFEIIPQDSKIIVKDIIDIFPSVKGTKSWRIFLQHMAQYYLSPFGKVLTLGIPSFAYEKLLKKKDPLDKKELIVLEKSKTLRLTEKQQDIFEKIQYSIQDKRQILLHGITGSGKSEILLSCAQEVWAKGKQVLFLLPEISLTIPWIQRYNQYFSQEPCIWHSFLTPKKRWENFYNSVVNDAPCIIGARSALCLPYKNLGLIIVDEEHEQSYKQSDGVLYHGRDMAILRGKHENIPVILSSASPSLETLYHVQENNCAYIPLLTRYNNLPLACFTCIDDYKTREYLQEKKIILPHDDSENVITNLSENKENHNNPKIEPHFFQRSSRILSDILLKKIHHTLQEGEQSLVFLNRRGYASLLVCPLCAHRYGCLKCKGWLSVHKKSPQLLCHYCNHKEPIPKMCHSCGFEGPMTMVGPGIEQLYEEIQHNIPKARLCLISSDHISSQQKMHDVLEKIYNREIDIIIGTQLVAKGHHFPYLTCIALLGSDQALQDIDFRGQERWMQTMIQVTGRAGREHRPGHAFLQTRYAQHPLFQAMEKGTFYDFSKEELLHRKEHDLPPFRRLTLVTFSHKNSFLAEESAGYFTLCQPFNPLGEKLRVFGPSPAPLSPLKGQYRWRLLLQSHRSFNLSAYLQQWISHFNEKYKKNISMVIDRDPYYLL